MDSLMSVELRNRLNRALCPASTSFPTPPFFDHPNVNALARHLAAELAQPGDTGDTHETPPAAQPTPPAPRARPLPSRTTQSP